jgi:proteasome lid subunit RPN8/RPN11
MQRLKPDPAPEVLNSIKIIDADKASDITILDDQKEDEISIVDDQLESTVTASAVNDGENSEKTLPQTIEVPEIFVENFRGFDTEQTTKDLALLVRRAALEDAKEHALEDTTRETGGVMLGTFVEDDDTITVVFTGIVPALRAVRESAALNFTEEAWAEIWRTIDQDKNYSDEETWRVIGWYHTHPGFSVCFSKRDKFIHKEYFTQNWHVALVIDPIQDDLGYFVTNNQEGEIIRADDDIGIQEINEKELRKFLKKEYKFTAKKLPTSKLSKDGGAIDE